MNETALTIVIPVSVADLNDPIRQIVGFVSTVGPGNYSRFELVMREMINEALRSAFVLGFTGIALDLSRSAECRYHVDITYVQDESASARTSGMDGVTEKSVLKTRNLSMVQVYAENLEKREDGIAADFSVLTFEQEFSVAHEAGSTIISPACDLVGAAGMTFKNRLWKELDIPVRRYVIDFVKVSLIDSRSIGILIAFHKALAARGGEMKLELVNVSDKVNELFQMANLDSIFHVQGRTVSPPSAPD